MYIIRPVHGAVRRGQLWGGILHHTYRVWFALMLDRTSPLKGKNQSTLGSVDHSRAVQLIQCKNKTNK